MFKGLDLSLEEEFALYAFLLRLRKKRGEKEKEKDIRFINQRLYDEIHKYVRAFAVKKYKNISNSLYSLDDYIDSAWVEVLLNFYKYNGENKLTTFVNCYISAGLRNQFESEYGSFYYRKKQDETNQNAKKALSIAKPEYIEDLSGEDFNIENENITPLLDESIVNSTANEIYHNLNLNPYEKRIITLYAGIEKGFYDKQYNIPMICTDPVLLQIIKKDSRESRKILDGPFKFQYFDESNNRYLGINKKTEHLSLSYVRNKIKKIQNMGMHLYREKPC